MNFRATTWNENWPQGVVRACDVSSSATIGPSYPQQPNPSMAPTERRTDLQQPTASNLAPGNWSDFWTRALGQQSRLFVSADFTMTTYGRRILKYHIFADCTMWKYYCYLLLLGLLLWLLWQFIIQLCQCRLLDCKFFVSSFGPELKAENLRGIMRWYESIIDWMCTVDVGQKQLSKGLAFWRGVVTFHIPRSHGGSVQEPAWCTVPWQCCRGPYVWWYDLSMRRGRWCFYWFLMATSGSNSG